MEKRKRSPKSVDRMKSFNCKNKRSSQLKIIVVVFHHDAIMILTLKRFSGRFEDVCRGPDASIKLKPEEVHKQFSRRL